MKRPLFRFQLRNSNGLVWAYVVFLDRQGDFSKEGWRPEEVSFVEDDVVVSEKSFFFWSQLCFQLFVRRIGNRFILLHQRLVAELTVGRQDQGFDYNLTLRDDSPPACWIVKGRRVEHVFIEGRVSVIFDQAEFVLFNLSASVFLVPGQRSTLCL